MELIERYIYAATKRLPLKQREDIQKELRTLIEDMISQRCGGNTPTNSDIEHILNELGDPSLLAAKYRDDKNYLIGPEYFDIYLFVLKIVVAAAAFGTGLAKTIGLISAPPDNIYLAIAELIAAIITGAFQGFAWITIIFAITERCATKKWSDVSKENWTVSLLPPVPHKEELIKPAEPIVAIVFAMIFLILINFANHLFGVFYVEDGNLQAMIPVFSQQVLVSCMPLFILLFCLTVLKESLKLIIGKWNLLLGGAVTVCNLVSLMVNIFIFTRPGLWNASFVNQMTAAGIAPPNLDVAAIWNGVTHYFIYIVVFGFIIESLVAIIKGIRYSAYKR